MLLLEQVCASWWGRTIGWLLGQQGGTADDRKRQHEVLWKEQGLSLKWVEIWDASSRLTVLRWETRARRMSRVVG